MSPLIEPIDGLLANLTLFGVLLIVASLLLYIPALRDRALKTIGKYGLWLAFTIALLATLGSLFYSEIAGYLPCKLCWFQRIFMYPQVIVLGIAAWKKQSAVTLTATLLSLLGALIAAYHYALQRVPELPDSNCGIVGYSASCSQYFVMEYGFITIPMMALVGFVLIILCTQLHRSYVRSNN